MRRPTGKEQEPQVLYGKAIFRGWYEGRQAVNQLFGDPARPPCVCTFVPSSSRPAAVQVWFGKQAATGTAKPPANEVKRAGATVVKL